MKNSLFMIMFTAIIVLSVTTYSDAGPVVIRDARINDLAYTPTLGRGYTLVTNTYQSMCMDNVVTTEPSYDFQYTFESIEKASSDSKTLSSKTSANAKVGYAMIEVSSMVEANAAVTTDVNETSHHIKVELNMDTYYASVNEAKTELSPAAKNLLTNKDLPGFFSACGSNYIRALGRNAKFVSIFTYTTKSTARDAVFEASLKLELSGMISGVTVGGGAESSTKSAFKNMASEKKLIINTRAWGLGKNEGASLISYDIDSFKAAVKDAFISMQNPMTGKITSMEVVPWVENTGFQDAIVLEETDSSVEKEKVPNYRKKDILNQNSEFLGEIQKADRNRINNYYTAKICKETINANYKQNDKFIEGYAAAKLVNNRTGKTTDMTLDKLDKLLVDVDGILAARDAFMYGDKGAEKCIDKMFGEDMFRKKWGEFAECTSIRGGFVSEINRDIIDYCMPTISPEAGK
ncbi:MAG TPA: hypothetical protein PLY36_07755 [Spirochaetota bacterium]|nr:hypothetical protein [Spirochaetota bacterium]